MRRPPNLSAFILAGLAAFSIDVSILGLLTSLDINPLTARLVGMTVALTVGWMINRTWTYGESNPPTAAEFGRYVAGGLTSTGVNFVVFALILIIWPGVSPLLALAAGAAAAISASFAGYARVVFREDP